MNYMCNIISNLYYFNNSNLILNIFFILNFEIIFFIILSYVYIWKYNKMFCKIGEKIVQERKYIYRNFIRGKK